MALMVQYIAAQDARERHTTVNVLAVLFENVPHKMLPTAKF
ncbi:hypothetical protein J2Y49_006409 [Azospirillum sp. BE72]|nr:hypothetical protein [Azospirillum sp. BE72]MDR6775641.1 hypothetical protein [Azospirillum sp. BE72]